MVRAAPLPPALAGRAFRVDEAQEAGVSRSRTRVSDLDVPFRGVRAPRGHTDFRARCEAYAVRMPVSQHFSHGTAARLLGLPLPPWIERDPTIHVTAVAAREPRVRGVAGHLAAEQRAVVEVSGLRVSAAVDTWCALASALSLDDLVVLGDALVRRKDPVATMQQLHSSVAANRRRRGSRRLALALALVRPGTDSPKETVIRLMIVRAGLPEPVVNARIVSGAGRFLALGDMVYSEYKVLVEYDGGYHFESEEQVYRDIDRLDAVMAEQWRVIRFNKTHLAREAHVTATVRAALVERGWRP